MRQHDKPVSPYGNDEQFTREQDDREHLRKLRAPRVPGDGEPAPSGGLVTDEMYAEFLEKHHGIKRKT